MLFTSCDNANAPEDKNWKLVWEDNFDGPAGQSPDATKWGYDIGTDWGNAQLEYDTDRPTNVSLDGEGNLAIVARKENYKGSAYTSARINTRGLFETTYGRFEVRMQMPWGQGLWPAFWLLGVDYQTVGWPQCGEIDILEYRGQEPTRVHGTVHGPGYFGGNGVSNHYDIIGGRFDNSFHLFAIEWEKDEIRFYVDDKPYHIITPDDLSGEWVFDHPFYIILNLAVGGNYVGWPNENTVFPQALLVDYVRVYE
ncbi:MAG: glycoside hydrolase family 16 protein [Calditrichaeota bacterium]|nr:MAG: glycoside hydrolase family 16 protein [Calditrichota bacterium]